MVYIKSLIEKRREINRQKGRKGVEARLLKLAEAPTPLYPLERDHDYQKITIKGLWFGQYREISFILLPVELGQGRCDQYALYAGINFIGIMGVDRIFDEIRKREFARVHAI